MRLSAKTALQDMQRIRAVVLRQEAMRNALYDNKVKQAHAKHTKTRLHVD